MAEPPLYPMLRGARLMRDTELDRKERDLHGHGPRDRNNAARRRYYAEHYGITPSIANSFSVPFLDQLDNCSNDTARRLLMGAKWGSGSTSPEPQGGTACRSLCQ